MKPIDFPGVNVVYAKDQPEYQPLPAMRFPDGQVITCWEFTEREKQIIASTGKIYINQLTFNQPLQPLMPQVELGSDVQIGPNALKTDIKIKRDLSKKVRLRGKDWFFCEIEWRLFEYKDGTGESIYVNGSDWTDEDTLNLYNQIM